jgi:preprotein translocase subunit SecY
MFITKLKLLWRDNTLRKKILFTLSMLVVFRLLAAVPISAIDTSQLAAFFSSNQFFGLLNIFSGGGLDNFSIVMLGVGPYITASIIMQLSTMMSAKLKTLYHEEGDAGKKKFSQYSRLLTVPLALLQGFGFFTLLQQQGVVPAVGVLELVTTIALIATGSLLLMWIGELISEFGIGNGVSLIIFAGIVAQIPVTVSQLWFTYFASFDPSILPTVVGFFVALLAIIAGVVAVTEAERPVPITYAKRVRGGQSFGGVSTYLPLRLNQSGVIPIIFALSILTFPQLVISFLARIDSSIVTTVSQFVMNIINNGLWYSLLYFVLVVLFTFFYTAVTFEPDSIATNLQKSGAFIPGVRPGNSTTDYLGTIVTRITLVGALFLGVVAVLPIIMQSVTGIAAFAIGGTALLIAVSVVLDLVKKIDAQISMREY